MWRVDRKSGLLLNPAAEAGLSFTGVKMKEQRYFDKGNRSKKRKLSGKDYYLTISKNGLEVHRTEPENKNNKKKEKQQ